jgi:hypothetical protein
MHDGLTRSLAELANLSAFDCLRKLSYYAVIVAWPSFALIAAYEMLMRQVRCNAARAGQLPQRDFREDRWSGSNRQAPRSAPESAGVGIVGRDLQRRAWQWAEANRADDGALPSGRMIARQFGRHERWGRLVKRSGCAGEFGSDTESGGSGRCLASEQAMSVSIGLP